MAFFSRDRGKEVPKGVPPDKSAGAWPSEQGNITCTGNVGKSPWEEYVRRVNDAKSRLKVQDKRRKHHAVNHQEDTPHGECPVNGVALPLPRPRCNLETLSPKELKPIHEPTRPRSVPAGIAQDTSHKHHVGKSPCEGTNAENQSLKVQETRIVVFYQKLLIKNEDMKDIPPVKPVKPAPRLSFGGLTVIRWKDQTIGGQTIPDDTFSFGGAVPGLTVIHVPPVKPVPSFSFGGQTKHDPRSLFGETKDMHVPPVKSVTKSAPNFSFGGQTKEVADERSVYDAEKDKDVEEEVAAIKRAEKKKAKRITKTSSSLRGDCRK